MKKLTLRLDDEHSLLLDSICEIYEYSTASAAIKDMIFQHDHTQEKLNAQYREIWRLQNIIAGLSAASDTFKAVLNVIDQQHFDLLDT